MFQFLYATLWRLYDIQLTVQSRRLGLLSIRILTVTVICDFRDRHLLDYTVVGIVHYR